MDPRVHVFNRNTYDCFGFLGDIGGLIDAVYYLIKIILLPMTVFNLKS